MVFSINPKNWSNRLCIVLGESILKWKLSKGTTIEFFNQRRQSSGASDKVMALSILQDAQNRGEFEIFNFFFPHKFIIVSIYTGTDYKFNIQTWYNQITGN